jgi:hypothetical protein
MWHFSTEVSIARVQSYSLNLLNHATHLVAHCSSFSTFYPSHRLSRGKTLASLTTRVYIHREMRPKGRKGTRLLESKEHTAARQMYNGQLAGGNCPHEPTTDTRSLSVV